MISVVAASCLVDRWLAFDKLCGHASGDHRPAKTRNSPRSRNTHPNALGNPDDLFSETFPLVAGMPRAAFHD